MEAFQRDWQRILKRWVGIGWDMRGRVPFSKNPKSMSTKIQALSRRSQSLMVRSWDPETSFVSSMHFPHITFPAWPVRFCYINDSMAQIGNRYQIRDAKFNKQDFNASKVKRTRRRISLKDQMRIEKSVEDATTNVSCIGIIEFQGRWLEWRDA